MVLNSEVEVQVLGDCAVESRYSSRNDVLGIMCECFGEGQNPWRP